MADYWKILTHDFRPPLQGGDPIWDGNTFPFKLNSSKLDTSDQECAAGWNFVDDIVTGFRIVGMWPTGQPSSVVKVNPSDDKIHRGDKWRCSVLELERFATNNEINSAIERFSIMFGDHANEMAKEQILWREALSRPLYDAGKVTENLQIALKIRGLNYRLEEYRAVGAAWDAWDAWAAWNTGAAWPAWATWDTRATWTAWATWAAWDAWDAGAARAAQAAWPAWAARAAWTAWDARNARAARNALTVQFASLEGWITQPKDLLTSGIRDAYLNGLEIAIPTGKNTLGFAMKDKP